MTLDQIMKCGCFLTKSDVARSLGITPGAVSQWRSGDPLPELHYLKMRYEILPSRGLSKREIKDLCE